MKNYVVKHEMVKSGKEKAFFCGNIMLHNINSLYLHCVFHGIRFKVNNEDWLSVMDSLFLFYAVDVVSSEKRSFYPNCPFFSYS